MILVCLRIALYSAGTHIVAELPRYHRDPTVWVPKYAMISFSPNVKPASRLQFLDYLADLERHNTQDNESPIVESGYGRQE